MKKFNLLVIDVDKELTATIKSYFDNSADIEVKYICSDGNEAINIIESNKSNIDLIILDPLVPNKDGLAILEHLKARKINRKVLVLSHFTSSTILMKAKELNVANYLMKPIELDILAERIREVLSLDNVSLLNKDREITELQRQITKIIHELGVPSNLKGYNYLRDGILRVYFDPSLAHKITKTLYVQIADKFSSTDARVERSMRHAIEVSWNRGNWELMEEIFGYSVSIDKSKPTNSEFIVTIADKLRLDNNKSSY